MSATETHFGKYKLLAKIAAGGMAVAYRAELAGAAGVKKRVVLKVIHSHLAQQKSFVEMFISEAKVAASLTHGNIAQIFDFGQIDGRYYLSMEEVIGQPLSNVLIAARARSFVRLPVPLALQIAIGVLDGLHYAHTRKDPSGQSLNLVHRDVTPDNVLLSYEGEIKVVDFGIAKTTFSVDQTEAGTVRGKYPYLSPEQASGQRDLDARTDQWATAVQLYDLLAGRRPYEGEFLPVMEGIVGPEPVPSLAALTPTVDAALEAIVLGALKKPRDQRYASAREFSLALTGYLHQKFPTSTRQDVAFLLATLFPAEAKKEGADVNVPREFAQLLSRTNAGAHAILSSTPGPPRPPVPTEPPVPVPPPPMIPRITVAEVNATRPSAPDTQVSRAAHAEAELDKALAGLRSSDPDDDELPTQAGIPLLPKPAAAPAPPPPPKKSDSHRKLKKAGSSGSKSRLPPVVSHAATPPEPSPKVEIDEVPTANDIRDLMTQPTPLVHDTEQQSVKADVPPRPKPRRGALIAVGVVLGLGVIGLSAFAVLGGNGDEPLPALPPDQPLVKPAPVAPVAVQPPIVVADPGPAIDSGVLAEPVPPKPAVVPANVGSDEAHLVVWPKRTFALRPAKMALPLSEYTPLRIELGGKAISLSTQGSVSLGPGRSTSSLLYMLETENPGPHFGVLTPNPRAFRGVKAITLFAIDDSLDDNSGTLKVVLHVSQYVPEKLVTFDAKQHVLVPKPEHHFRLEGLDPTAQYLWLTRPDMPMINAGKDGHITEVLCLLQGAKPLPFAKSVRVIPVGAKVTLADVTGLQCLFPDDKLDDNSGSVEVDLVDAARAAAEGVDPKQYALPSKW